MLTVGLFLASGFDADNIVSGGAFASLSFYYGLSYAAVSVSLTVLYAAAPSTGWLGRFSPLVGWASFVLSGLILYWSTWPRVRVAVPLMLIGLLAYLWRSHRRQTSWHGFATRLIGFWLVALLAGLVVLSKLGSFGGLLDLVPAPADSLVAGCSSPSGGGSAAGPARQGRTPPHPPARWTIQPSGPAVAFD